MKNNKYVIGISCIGSGVGQSVITSCRLSNLPLYTVGLGTNAFAFGAYECDEYDYTKSIYAPDFVDDIIEKCLKHDVDLLIPGRDDEALIYAQNQDKFEDAGIKTIVADQKFIEICRDKERMSRELNPIQDVFVKCYKKEELFEVLDLGDADFPLIAKPRGGFASNGIEIILSPDDFHRITEDHIIQELAIPLQSDPNYDFYVQQIQKRRNPQVSEISIQVVLGKGGELLGRMASFNKLNNGVPIEIVPYSHDLVWEVVDSLMPTFKEMGFVGPLNIQGRLTNKGLKLFEMNPRFTGITGLRGLMGFNEVDACIRNWLCLGEGADSIHLNPNKFGIRQTTDKAISFKKSEQAKKVFTQINYPGYKEKRKVLVTGASRYLASSIIQKMLKLDEFSVVAVGRDKRQVHRQFKDNNITIFDNSDLLDGKIYLGEFDSLVHTAFARPDNEAEDIADSMQFTQKLFTLLGEHHVPEIVNISSQSVYGDYAVSSWTESERVIPNGLYGQAKYAVELWLDSIKRIYPHINCTSLRLSTLYGAGGNMRPIDAISKMVKKALDEKTISIINSNLPLNRLHVDDAADAVLALLLHNDVTWNSVYNVANNTPMTIGEIASSIKDVGHELLGEEYTVIDEGKPYKETPKLRSDLFCQSFGWNPQTNIKDNMKALIRLFMCHGD